VAKGVGRPNLSNPSSSQCETIWPVTLAGPIL